MIKRFCDGCRKEISVGTKYLVVAGSDVYGNPLRPLRSYCPNCTHIAATELIAFTTSFPEDWAMVQMVRRADSPQFTLSMDTTDG